MPVSPCPGRTSRMRRTWTPQTRARGRRLSRASCGTSAALVEELRGALLRPHARGQAHLRRPGPLPVPPAQLRVPGGLRGDPGRVPGDLPRHREGGGAAGRRRSGTAWTSRPRSASWCAIDPGYRRSSPTSRLDSFITTSAYQFVELNAESPAGIAYNEVLVDVFLELPVMKRFQERWHAAPLPRPGAAAGDARSPATARRGAGRSSPPSPSWTTRTCPPAPSTTSSASSSSDRAIPRSCATRAT